MTSGHFSLMQARLTGFEHRRTTFIKSVDRILGTVRGNAHSFFHYTSKTNIEWKSTQIIHSTHTESPELVNLFTRSNVPA
jgi:hypothetical protein